MKSLEKKIISCIAKVLKVEESKLTVESGAGDLVEWDSLAHTNIILAIEEEFNFSFDIEEALEIEIVQDVVDIISENEKR